MISLFSGKSGRGRTLPERRNTWFESELRKDGWVCVGFAAPHADFGCRHPDHGAMLVGVMHGDLAYIPLEGLASLASERASSVIILTFCDPPVHVNATLVERNVYMMRYDAMPMIPSALAILRAQQELQRKIASNSASTRREFQDASEEAARQLAIVSEDLVRQLFEGIMRRPASDGDVAHYAAFVRERGENGVRDLSRVLSTSGEFLSRVQATASADA